MNRLRHTYIYTLVLVLGALLTSTSCVRDYDSLEEDDGKTYLSLTLSLAPSGNDELRVQGDDYSINSDKTNREDYVNDLRIFLIQDGVIKKNVFFTNLVPKSAYTDWSKGSEEDGISYKYQKGKAQVTFKLKEFELGYYDLVVVANEGAYTNRASLDPGPDYHEKYDNEKWREIAAEEALKKALKEAKTLDDLKQIRIPVTRRFSDTHQGRRYNQSNPYIDVISPMTAEYEHIDFTGGGTKDNPRQIELSNPYGRTKGIELLRTFAKVELLYKKCIWLSWDENGKEELKWIGPWRFQHPYGPHIYQMPKDVSLFPIQEYSSAQDTVSSFLGRESDQYMARTGPQKRFIIGYDKIAEKVRKEGVPIGGGYLLDYRMYFYIPEKLVPEGPDETVKPLYLWFIWYHYSGFRPWLDIASNNHQLRAETKCYFDVLNIKNRENNKDRGEDYVKRIPGSFDPSDKSVYRNRLYKITLTPKDVQPPAGNGEAFE
ncbi:hypothetical protein [uncultured Porphyromonas sp.]|uniref:hypothetical protein n=2 Tax=uncultured Porphyromonas sp. TaxID=159274 RepID=UPI0026249E68|nr:hypothetical protein [uncultured Porphyromonas sp.]